jgi:hypothetical protein
LSGSAAAELPAENTTGVTRRIAIGTLLGATAGAAATGLFAMSRYRSDGTPRSLGWFTIPLPEGHVFTVGFNKRVAISPDGAYLACNPIPRGPGANIFVRSMRALEMRLVEGARGVPFFSHDSRSIGYFTTDAPWRLRKVALSGGAPANICNLENFSGAAWAADDMIYFVPAVPGGLVRVAAAGGDPVPSQISTSIGASASTSFRTSSPAVPPCCSPWGRLTPSHMTTPNRGRLASDR